MLTSFLFEKILSKTDTAKVFFEDKRCLRSRCNKSECRACLDECQAGALKLDGRVVAFKQENCTGCMRCLSVCPNDAFDGGLDLKELVETVGCFSQVVITCRRNAHFQQKIVVPCVGSLSEAILAAMNSVAVDSFFVDLSHCSECVNKHCLSSFSEKLEELTERLKAHQDVPLKCSIEKNSAHYIAENLARRSYLGMAKKSLIDLGREAIDAGQKNTSNSHNRTEKGPSMSSAALQYAFRKASKENKQVLRSFFYTVKVTEQCSVCPGCQGMCPTGALKRIEVEGEKRLMFTSSACNGCSLCGEFCKKAAIKVGRGFSGDPEEPLCIG